MRSCLVLQCSHLPYWPDHQRRLANWLDACVLHKRTTFLFWRAFQPAELCRNGATLSLACCHMEPWHLLHSALTRPSSGNAWHLKSRHPFFTRCSTTHQSFDDNNRSAVECRKVGVHYETRYFYPQPTLLERHCQEQRQIAQPECGRRHLGPVRNKLAKIFTGVLYQFSIVRKLTEGTIGRTPGDWFPWTKFLAAPLTAWARLNHLCTGVGCSRSCLHKWVWPPLRFVSVAQKNIYVVFQCPTHLPLMNCTAWSGWWQWIDCSTPALRPNAAEQ